MDEKVTVCQASVVSNQQIAKDTWEIRLKPEEDFPWVEVEPGKFICLAPLSADSSMSRPFSICDTSLSRGTFSLLYKTVGKNTELMAALKPGWRVKIWGPLGHNFKPNYTAFDEVWLVGGGIGIAPLNFFDRYVANFLHRTTRVFYGVKTKEEFIGLNFYSQEPILTATDDGSAGHRGLITDLLPPFIKAVEREQVLVITCGPNIMMRKVAEICQQTGIECHVILEKIMACGFGVCLGCSVQMKSGQKRICHDGPIFNAKEVDWNALS